MRTQIEPKWPSWYFYIDEQGNYSVLVETGGHNCAMADVFLTEEEYLKMIKSPKDAWTFLSSHNVRKRLRIIRTACQPTDFQCIPDKLESAEEYTLRTGL